MYYKLAKKYHPDKVDTTKREHFHEVFTVVNSVYSILSDHEKKLKYDEIGAIDPSGANNIQLEWMKYVRPVTESDFEKARRRYAGSQNEIDDIKKELIATSEAAKKSVGMVQLFHRIPFMRVENEDRIMNIVKQLMKNGEVIIFLVMLSAARFLKVQHMPS